MKGHSNNIWLERTLEAAWGVFMNTKNDVEVVINGKQYTMSGYESTKNVEGW